MSTTLPTRTYHPALDGLRGLACLMVVFYHNFPFLHKYLFFAWLSIDIFFVLSGYLITDILLNTYGEKNYLRNFYVRRLLRVFPLYYLSMALFIFVLPNISSIAIQMDYFVNNQVYFWTFLQNWLLIFNPSNNQFALNHLWSMAVEEQFYLLWPFLVALVKKPKILLTVVSLLFLFFIGLRAWLWVERIETLSYFNLYTFTRIDGICVGCMVALLQKINSKFLEKNTATIVLCFALINFIFYFLNREYENSFPYLAMVGYSTFAMIFGLLVYDIINKNTPLFTNIFNLSFLKFIGMISYGTYIFHWPLYLALKPFLVKWSDNYIPAISPEVLASSVATLLAFILGYFSYRFFELKFLRLKKYFA